MNYFVSERIYEYFSRHASLYQMDENLFEIQVKNVLNEAKKNQIARLKTEASKPPAAAEPLAAAEAAGDAGAPAAKAHLHAVDALIPDVAEPSAAKDNTGAAGEPSGALIGAAATAVSAEEPKPVPVAAAAPKAPPVELSPEIQQKIEQIKNLNIDFDKLTSSDKVWGKYMELMNECQNRFQIQGKIDANKDFINSHYGQKEVKYTTVPG